MTENPPRLTSAEAAARLRVKPETLYAYVSRGLLTRERTGAGSTFDPLEIEAFALRRARAEAAPRIAASPGMPLMVLDTDIAQIEDDELYFRGRPASRLALESSLESVAAWLWGTGEPLLRGDRGRTPETADAVRVATAALPAAATPLDRIQVAVAALAASDPLRHDATADGLRRAGARLLAGIPIALGAVDADAAAEPVADAEAAAEARAAEPETADAAARLWRALAGRPPRPAERRALSAALVLTVDHDLAVSTLAARVAASARASGYAVVTAALGAFDAPLHGSASRSAARLLARVVEGEAVEEALAAVVREDGRGIPGFGHPLYRGTDPRAAALLPLVALLDGAEPVAAAVDALAGDVERHAGLRPNLDLALGALALAARLPPDAGAAIFALGRTVGWIAHALDEYGHPPLRLRPRGRYVGP